MASPSERNPDPHRPRVMGLETEYGILLAGGGPLTELQERLDELHPMHLSNAVVRAYGQLVAQRPTGWDYETESPLADQRGFELARSDALAEQLTDVESGLANLVLTNGARLYVDHAHPEYATPEVTTARDAVLWDRAGDQAMVLASRAASEVLGREIRLYRNNTDGKGASYGSHENYLLHRSTPFSRVVVQFTPFLVSRSVVVGAGRVGIGQSSELAGFQLSQRADFFETEVGLETTVNRPIINTRDEPHADARTSRRLHVITGDASSSEYAGWLKVGTAALVLALVEAGTWPDPPRLLDPVRAMHEISHDPTLRATVELDDGRRLSGLDLQQLVLDAVRTHLARAEEDPGAEAAELLTGWQQVLDDLRTDPARCADRLDWVAKQHLLERYRERDGLAWDAPKLALVDLQYADIDPRRSLHAALVARGRMRRLVGEAEVEHARTSPPTDTRAWFRGQCMRRFADQVVAASWDSVIFQLDRERSWIRLPMPDPLRGTRAHVGELFDRAADAGELLALLGS
ncbi:proteasome accessory factor PafA2 [Auraticoccus sp. F435]|uniref:Proteasome accessory factor PafA2 n=1 Tax=Auraticoccus cholistanensis TaxID=2656650 RepID=A0A6A9USU3_9ACTN|nr:depupylase/deamidase Dop [Auraticoccus cholistanensis]MVA75893.1 proteasome accessory factor PafA2 [Auraticoccus cholistanensis]